MRILLIEDDRNLTEFLRNSLEAESFDVESTSDGDKGIHMAKNNRYNVIIVDNILPKKTGMEICQELRQSGITTPIIMLSVLNDVTKKVRALNAGADDYITKPFSFQELFARIKAILRRPKNIHGEILQIDDLKLDINKHQVIRGKNEIYLTRKELLLLKYLMEHPGNVLSRAMIMEHVWETSANNQSNTIETHILNLRRKIDIEGKNKLIHTIPGRGYKIELKEPAERSASI